MGIISLHFLLFTLLAIIAYNLVRNLYSRQIVLFVFNLIFILTYAHSLTATIPLFLILIYGYLLIRFSYKQSIGRVTYCCIAVMIVLFIYVKKYPIFNVIPGLPFDYTVIGLSYILFRMIHLTIDVSSGAYVDKISPISYFNYTCSFLTLASGPIQRYQDFENQIKEAGQPLNGCDFKGAFSRIANGYIKIMFFSGMFSGMHTFYAGNLVGSGTISNSVSYSSLSLSIACYTLFVYFNFSGCMDVVIGLGKMFGFKLPENFNRPFTAENFLDLWSKWHMTLSEWFKIYMFNPMLTVLMRKWPSRKLTSFFGVICYFSVFSVIGLWHESLGVGIFLGVGAGLNKLFENTSQSLLGKKRFRQLEKMFLYRYLGRSFSFSYLSFSLICLWMGTSRAFAYFKLIGVNGTFLTLLLTTVYVFISVCLVDIFLIYYVKVNSISRLKESPFLHYASMGAKLFFISYLSINGGNLVPEFLYQKF